MKQSNKNNLEKQKSKKDKQEFKGIALLLFVVVLYIVLSFFQTDEIIKSLKHYGKTILIIIPIFLIVILLTSIINYYFPKEKIATMLQSKSKLTTSLLSLIAGIISHGPIMAWFPLLDSLKEKGVSKGGLVTFFYGRSVKLTLLPVMIGFFGGLYTSIYIFYLAAGAVVQGIIYDWIDSKN